MIELTVVTYKNNLTIIEANLLNLHQWKIVL